MARSTNLEKKGRERLGKQSFSTKSSEQTQNSDLPLLVVDASEIAVNDGVVGTQVERSQVRSNRSTKTKLIKTNLSAVQLDEATRTDRRCELL